MLDSIRACVRVDLCTCRAVKSFPFLKTKIYFPRLIYMVSLLNTAKLLRVQAHLFPVVRGICVGCATRTRSNLANQHHQQEWQRDIHFLISKSSQKKKKNQNVNLSLFNQFRATMPSSITEDDSHFEAVQEQMEKAQSSGGSVRSLFTSGYVRTRTSRALRKPI